ncbi:MAG: tRNA (N6-threonylcarbamoyladenosine(37)-N6)-methyltransferase TrmO [Bryobacteraceae bacterium]|nr:tRNA (N6-threonylcarbamoyladenosine(37)-N6)-methyltransferase TrmO [Bryobacteraceae bacterium]
MDLRPIGVVRCAVRERKTMPPWGVPARIELHEGFEAGLHRIEKHTHLWVLAWLDTPPAGHAAAERDVLQVTPRGVREPGEEGKHGVFAVRSPARPNPIGLTASRLLSVEGRSLSMERLDFLDGTPVLDLKPYFVTRDMIYAAGGRQIGAPASREALRESLTAQAVAFHGRLAPGLALGVRMIEHFRLTHHSLNDPPSWRVEAPLSDPILLDALLGITRVSPGRGTLILHQECCIRLNLAAEYCPAPALPASADEILSAPDQALFTYRSL